MASQSADHTGPPRCAPRQPRAFPSRRATAVAVAIEVGALVADVPLAGHIAIMVATQAAVVLTTLRHGRPACRP